MGYDKSKLGLLIKGVLLGVVTASFDKLSLAIYSQGIYSNENRGKVENKSKDKENDQRETRNQNRGLMRGYMPVAPDDIARSQAEIPYLKPSDQSLFLEKSAWVQSNFDKLVHPYRSIILETPKLCFFKDMTQFTPCAVTIKKDSALSDVSFFKKEIEPVSDPSRPPKKTGLFAQ